MPRQIVTEPQPPLNYGGSVRGIQAEYPPLTGTYVGQEPLRRGPTVNAMRDPMLGQGGGPGLSRVPPAPEPPPEYLPPQGQLGSQKMISDIGSIKPQPLARRGESAGKPETFATMPRAEAQQPSGATRAPEQVESAIKKAGGVYKGTVEGNVWFDDPQTKSTLLIPEADFSEAAVRDKLEASRKDFAAKAPAENSSILESKPGAAPKAMRARKAMEKNK